jgi:16S rRNA (guanine527-N7)-methyltransferase
MPPSQEFKKTVKEWFARGDQKLSPDFIPGAALYHDLIRDWSKRFNIVSRNDLDILLERHILDSLVPIKEIPPKGLICDIGSGAGFPVIPIALVRPELDIIMIESRRKKVIFLNEAVSKLELPRVTIWEGRFEDFSPAKKVDIITIRAVAVTDKTRKHSREILKESGKIIYYNKFNSYQLL